MSTPLCMGIARLYSNQNDIDVKSPQYFANLDIGGVLCFMIDRKKRVNQFRMYDINNYRLLFQCEIYINMHKKFHMVQPYFYCFPMPKMVLGIEFSSQKDAMFMQMLVKKYCPKMDVDNQESFI